MSNLSANVIVDEVIRGIAVGTVFRVVVEGRPVLSMSNVNFGLKLAGANLAYSVVRPVVNPLLPAAIQLPNGGK